MKKSAGVLAGCKTCRHKLLELLLLAAVWFAAHGVLSGRQQENKRKQIRK